MNTECKFCDGPVSSRYEARGGYFYCDFHAGWIGGVMSCAKIQYERAPDTKLAIEGLSFDESYVPHATKLNGDSK